MTMCTPDYNVAFVVLSGRTIVVQTAEMLAMMRRKVSIDVRFPQAFPQIL